MLTLPSLGGGGAERVTMMLARLLDRTRFEPEILVGRAEGALAADVAPDVPVHEMGLKRARNTLPAMLERLRARRPQVHMATLGMVYPAGLLAPVVRAHTGTALRLGSILGADFRRLARTEPLRIALARAALAGVARLPDMVIVQSETMRDDALQTLGHFGLATRMRRVHNPVDVERVRRAAGERYAPGPGLRLIAVGRLSAEKGYDLLLEALALAHARGLDAELDIYGDGPERQALEAQRTSLGLGQRVRFRGFVENPWREMARADLMVLPSRYEGFANVLLEALVVGTPVIASDTCGDVHEVIRPGRDGEIFAAASVQALTDAILVAAERQRAGAYHDAGAEIPQRFGQGAVVRVYEELFRSLAQGRSTS